MPIFRVPVPPPQIIHCQYLGWLQIKGLSSSSSTPSRSDIVRLILEQKSSSEAIKTFRWASDIPGFVHSQSTYRALIHKLCSFRNFSMIKDLLDEMPRYLGSPPDNDTFVTLIQGLGRAGMIRQAVKVLDMVSKFQTVPSIKVFNSVLNVLVKENIELARDFYRDQMMASGVKGNDRTFGILMKGLCRTNRFTDAFKLLNVMKSSDTPPNTVIYNTLLHALCHKGSTDRARKLLDEMHEPSDSTFNILISAYCADGDVMQAIVMLEKCLNSGILPDIIAVTKVLEGLCGLGRATEAVELLDRVESQGVKLDVLAYNKLIKGFCKLGKPKVGSRIMKDMEGKGCLPSTDTYNLLIAGFCESNMLESAVDLFDEMKTVGIKMNFDTYDTMIRALCSGGRTKDGFQILQIMEESKDGCRGRISPYNSILYGLYKENRTDEGLEFLTNMEKLFPKAVSSSLRILDKCKESKIHDAKEIYDQMVSGAKAPSAFVFDCLICGFCREGSIQEAVEMMNQMFSCGYSPIASTVNSIVRGFCDQGRMDSATRLMEHAEARGCVPDAQSYGHVVHCLCKKRDFDSALRIFLQMIDKSIVPHYFCWNSLILCLTQEKEWLEKSSDDQVKNLEYIMGK